MRVAVDTGGTFTDLAVEDGIARRQFKSPTTPNDPTQGVMDVIALADAELGLPDGLLRSTSLFIHGTTQPINAVLTGRTARTAFFTTRGHPDVLLFREGGRTDPFDLRRPYPPPYVPRRLTFEMTERMDAGGDVVMPLDEEQAVTALHRVRALDVESIGVCFLWATLNPTHEVRMGELIHQELPEVAYSLSHALNPILREYRRASATVIDASLKPLMASYVRRLETRLREVGFNGRALFVTSVGTVVDFEDIAAAPIHALGSGPAMAPIAGREYAFKQLGSDLAIVADTGGTSYDVSVVRRGRIPFTQETWLGDPYFSHMTGFPSIDVRSIGAGGGSIAWVDTGGLLHVGPQSAGADPGPVCYGRGGTEPTVTDASLVLGYLNPEYFLGGRMKLDEHAASSVLETRIGRSLRLDAYESAAAVLDLASELMVGAIEQITLWQGIDPRLATLVAGGGAGGLNAVAIARRLGCRSIVIPDVAPVLSAAGALIADLGTYFAATCVTSTSAFDMESVNGALAELETRCRHFLALARADHSTSQVEYWAAARYPRQVWELDLPLRHGRFSSHDDVEALRQDFHDLHLAVFAIDDRESPVEIVGIRAHARCRLAAATAASSRGGDLAGREPLRGDRQRGTFMPDVGHVSAKIVPLEAIREGDLIEGPAIVETPLTTVVVNPGAGARRQGTNLLLSPWLQPDRDAESPTTNVST